MTALIAPGLTVRKAQTLPTIANDSFIVDDVEALGNMHSERGLTHAEVAFAGHMKVALLAVLQYLRT